MSIVGAVIKYKGDRSINMGVVLDKILMLERTEEDSYSITGYLVQNVGSEKIHIVEYYKVLGVIPSQEDKDDKILKGQSDEDFFNPLGDKDVLGAMRIPRSTTTTTKDEEDDLPF